MAILIETGKTNLECSRKDRSLITLLRGPAINSGKLQVTWKKFPSPLGDRENRSRQQFFVRKGHHRLSCFFIFYGSLAFDFFVRLRFVPAPLFKVREVRCADGV